MASGPNTRIVNTNPRIPRSHHPSNFSRFKFINKQCDQENLWWEVANAESPAKSGNEPEHDHRWIRRTVPEINWKYSLMIEKPLTAKVCWSLIGLQINLIGLPCQKCTAEQTT